MGTVVTAEELPGTAELDELYRLDASETGPEDEEDQDVDEDGGETVEPEDRPHP
jgi:hypothetical protein